MNTDCFRVSDRIFRSLSILAKPKKWIQDRTSPRTKSQESAPSYAHHVNADIPKSCPMIQLKPWGREDKVVGEAWKPRKIKWGFQIWEVLPWWAGWKRVAVVEEDEEAERERSATF
jgi:hypothetical protein